MEPNTYSYLPGDSAGSRRDAGRLVDRIGRSFDYIRIAVNERCNLRCRYCLPEEGIDFQPEEHLLTSAEIIRVIRLLAPCGVRKIRFTGGEPLLHREIVELVEAASSTPGVGSVHLTTNGLLLAKKAVVLQAAGLTGVNLSLDTLQGEKFRRITRRDGLEAVLEGLEKVLALQVPAVKLNVVALRGFNDDELGDFVELTRDKPLTIRFIELMPFDAHQIWKTGKFYRAQQIVQDLLELYPDLEPAEGSSTEHYLFQRPGYRGKVAVIPSYSRDLCGGCSRVRLTADGKIRNCLYAHREYDLRPHLRNGAGNGTIVACFQEAMWNKLPDGWEAQRRGAEHRLSMTQIGG